MSEFGVSVEFVGKVDAQETVFTEEVFAKNSHQSTKMLFTRILTEPEFFYMFNCDISFQRFALEI